VLTFYFVNGLEYRLVPEARIDYEGKVGDEIVFKVDEDSDRILVKEMLNDEGPAYKAGVRPGWILSKEDSFTEENPGKRPGLSAEDAQADLSKISALENVTLIFDCEDAEPVERGVMYGEMGCMYEDVELDENSCTVSWETDGDGTSYPERRWGILALIIPADAQPVGREGPTRWNWADGSTQSVRLLSGPNTESDTGEVIDRNIRDPVEVSEEVCGENGEVAFLKLADGSGWIPVADDDGDAILKKASLWEDVMAEASEVVIRAEGIGDATPLASREGWDEARLRALCARHGWEFEWMSEDGERRRRGAERQSLVPLPTVTMKADTHCPDGFHRTAVTEASTSLLSSDKPHFLSEEIFKKYDKNGNGFLEVSELSALMKDAFPSEKFTEDDMAVMFQILDMDKDGSIATNELRAFLRCYQPGTQKIRTKSALVIVDVQNDFITGTLANPYQAADIVPIINGLRDKFDVVVISYDWHPNVHCSFVECANAGELAIKEEGNSFEPFTFVTLLEDPDRPEHAQILYPRHAVQGTEGGKTHADLIVKDSDLKVYKGVRPNIDSYSAFFDNMKANDTGLTAMLENENVTDVYCCGLVTDICVKSTALHGAEVGFNAFVIHDASRPLSNDNVEPTKKLLAEAGVGWLSVAEAVAKVAAKTDISLQEYMSQIKAAVNVKRIHSEVEPTLNSHAGPKA